MVTEARQLQHQNDVTGHCINVLGRVGVAARYALEESNKGLTWLKILSFAFAHCHLKSAANNTMTIRTASQNGTLGVKTAEKESPSHESGTSLPAQTVTPASEPQNGLPVLNGAKGHATSPYDNPRLTLVDRYVDEPRSLRVAVIGGGLAGILAGVLLPKKVPGIKLTIYEKNADLVRATLTHLPSLAYHEIGRHVV